MNLCVFLLLAGAGEIALRWVVAESDATVLVEELAGSGRLFGLRPHTRCLKHGVEVQINSFGFRERPYPIAKSPGVKRIAVLGDSFTFAVAVSYEEGFTRRLHDRMNQTCGPVEVLNFGVPGYNTAMELATLREVAANFAPDLIIVAYVLNDTEQRIRVGGRWRARPEGSGWRSQLTEMHYWLKDHSLLGRFLSPKLAGAVRVFSDEYRIGATAMWKRSYAGEAPGWVGARRALLGIAEESRRFGADLLVCILPMMLDIATYPLADAHEKVAAFCSAQGIEVLDLLPSFAGREAGELRVFLDSHPNARAHEIIADAVHAYLRAHAFCKQ